MKVLTIILCLNSYKPIALVSDTGAAMETGHVNFYFELCRVIAFLEAGLEMCATWFWKQISMLADLVVLRRWSLADEYFECQKVLEGILDLVQDGHTC